MNLFKVGNAMIRRGVVGPAPPQNLIRQLNALHRWGFGLAGELRQATAHSPKAIAIIDDGVGETSYELLLATSEQVADILRAKGYGPGDRIGLLARNHALAVAVMCGASALGVELVLGNTGLGAAQLALVAKQQEIQALIYDDEFASMVSDLEDIRLISESQMLAWLDRSPSRVDLPIPPKPGRTIILTSGTTGTPKGAARKTPGGFGPLVTIIDRIPLNSGDRMLISAPIFHTWGFGGMQLALAMRSTMVFQRRFDPQSAKDALEEYNCEAMFAIPVMLQRMMELPPDPQGKQRRPRLRVVASSGSAFPSGFTTKFMDEYGDVLYNMYGSTEASWVCIATPGDMRVHPDTAGTPPMGTVVKILDEEGREVPPGEQGRIFCGNDLVFEGYTNGQNKDFIAGMVSTGDVGHTEGPLLFVDGREDDMIVSGGENVYPMEVESALADMDEIREVAVVGLADPKFGQRLAAFIALNDGATLTVEEVKAHVKETRSRHCVPRDVIFVEELPRNATGKVLLRVLRQEYAAGT